MAAEHWFRWHHGTVNDPKFRVIASRCVTFVTVGHVVAVWSAMMENASLASPRGELSGWNDEDVASGFGFDLEQVRCIREAMQSKVLDGNVLMSWEKRQPKREDTSSSRTKDWRKRNVTQCDANKVDVTQCDATKHHVTLETETETETDIKETPSSRDEYSKLFLEFWAAYPRKVGKDEACKAFKKRKFTTESIVSMLRALKNQSAGWDDPKFIPHAATWLNNGRWKDGETVRTTSVPSYLEGITVI